MEAEYQAKVAEIEAEEAKVERRESKDILDSGEPTTIGEILEALWIECEVVSILDISPPGEGEDINVFCSQMEDRREAIVRTLCEAEGVVSLYFLKDGCNGDWEDDWRLDYLCYSEKAWEKHLAELKEASYGST